MLDELELAFDEQDRMRVRHRHRRSTMRRTKRAAERGADPAAPRRRGRSLLALLLSIVLLGGLGVGGWYGYGVVKNFFTAPDYTGAGTGSVQVQVNNGETATDIANTLYKASVVKSAKAFVDAAKSDPHGDQVQPGTYKLHKHMRASAALTALLATDGNGTLINKVSTKVTIPEGTISVAAFQLLSKATKIPVTDFEAAAKDPVALGVPDWWFKRTDGKPVTKSIEGFLFPATYEFNPGADAKTVLSTMVAKFNAVNAELKFSDTVQGSRNISPYEALIAASIAQAEAPLQEDMSKVARVLYNRAYSGKFPCSCLQLDSTVNYWLRVSGKEAQDSKNLTVSQLHDPNDPYNTHDVAGMPIGPISNPGKEALQAAESPADGQWMYFVTIDKQGHTAFSNTFDEFQQNVALAKKNGVL